MIRVYFSVLFYGYLFIDIGTCQESSNDAGNDEKPGPSLEQLSIPGGYNALRRMYTDIQEPMLSAAQEQVMILELRSCHGVAPVLCD